jgi:hypothetical protein
VSFLYKKKFQLAENFFVLLKKLKIFYIFCFFTENFFTKKRCIANLQILAENAQETEAILDTGYYHTTTHNQINYFSYFILF